MIRHRCVAGYAALMLAACGGGDETRPPVAGELTVAYAEGGRAAGALLLTVSGGPVEAVDAIPSGLAVSSASPGTGITRVVVVGALISGDLLKLRVPDLDRAAQYTVRAEQVADAADVALLDPAAYRFTVRR